MYVHVHVYMYVHVHVCVLVYMYVHSHLFETQLAVRDLTEVHSHPVVAIIID